MTAKTIVSRYLEWSQGLDSAEEYDNAIAKACFDAVFYAIWGKDSNSFAYSDARAVDYLESFNL